MRRGTGLTKCLMVRRWWWMRLNGYGVRVVPVQKSLLKFRRLKSIGIGVWISISSVKVLIFSIRIFGLWLGVMCIYGISGFSAAGGMSGRSVPIIVRWAGATHRLKSGIGFLKLSSILIRALPSMSNLFALFLGCLLFCFLLFLLLVSSGGVRTRSLRARWLRLLRPYKRRSTVSPWMRRGVLRVVVVQAVLSLLLLLFLLIQVFQNLRLHSMIFVS